MEVVAIRLRASPLSCRLPLKGGVILEREGSLIRDFEGGVIPEWEGSLAWAFEGGGFL